MSAEENAALLFEVFDSIERRDNRRFRELLDPEFEIVWPQSLPYGGTARGPAPTGPTWGGTWTPLQPTSAERAMDARVVATGGTQVVVLWRQRGRSPLGARVNQEVLGLYTVRDRKLLRAQMFYFDTVEMARFLDEAGGTAAGASPLPPQADRQHRAPAFGPVHLVGDHVELLPMDASHVDALYEAGKSPDIWAYMPMRVASRDDMARLVREALQALDDGREMPFVIRDRGSGRIVGSTRFLTILPAHRAIEIGWTWLSPAAWRTPINTECKCLLLRHCFETLDLIRVQLKTDARNERSQRAIERLGAVREGVLRHHVIMPDGYLRDSVYYSILAEEWPGVRARLGGLLRNHHE